LTHGVEQMHELAIAKSIIELAKNEALEHRLEQITEIGVRVGALSGINCDALRFSLDALVVDTSLEGMKLIIDELPAKGICLKCNHEHVMGDFIEECPVCKGLAWKILQGEELELVHVSGVDKEENKQH